MPATMPMLRWSVQSLMIIVFLFSPVAVSAQSESPGNILSRPVLGEEKILFIRVKYPDDDRVVLSNQRAPIHANALKAIIETNSYDKLKLDIDITPILLMPQPTSFYELENRLPFVRIRADAIKIAKDAGFHESDYDREFIYTKKLWPQDHLALGGLNERTSYLAIDSPTVAAHEMGHTFGWKHASFWRVTGANPIATEGELIEYGDKFDIMGDHGNFHHFNPWFKSRLGWIPPESILTVSESETYIIRALEKPPLSGSPVTEYSALKIHRSPDTDYWVFYRSRENMADAGAIIVQVKTSNFSRSVLLDMTPGSKSLNKDYEDAALAVGKTILDQEAGIEIKVLGKNSDSLAVEVVVPQIPIDILPVIDIVNPAFGITLQGAVDYEATAFDPDVGHVNGAGIDTVKFVLVSIAGDDSLVIQAEAQLTSPPYILHVETNGVPDEAYRLFVTAISQNGGTNTGFFRHIIDNTGPSVPTTIDEKPLEVSRKFQLQQNYPNPFNPSTTIHYSVERAGKAGLRIYDLLGRKVRSLVQENKPAGEYSVLWNGRDDADRLVASGSYFYELRVGEFVSTKRMLLLK